MKKEWRHFGEPAVIAKSPGRINIIGEHTDYNGGFILPAAIDRYVTVAASLNDHNHINIYSVQYDQQVMVPVDSVKKIKHQWANYVLGIVDQLQQGGYVIHGCNLVIDGDIPVGAGLSSSAAMLCVVCAALNELFQCNLAKMDIVLIAQKAEHEYAGVHCGIMDHFVSVHGRKDNALLLDCHTIKHKLVPLELNDYRIVLFNTNVKHSLASSAYNHRRDECAQGLQQVQRHIPQVRTLRDVSRQELILYVHDPVVHNRCRFVIEENERVQKAVVCLQAGDIAGLGHQLYFSHEGLAHDYDVSCPELDWLVASVRHRSYVAGARMMGGGFGGCTINLVKKNYVEQLVSELTESYERFMGLTLTTYDVATADGTHVITQHQTA